MHKATAKSMDMNTHTHNVGYNRRDVVAFCHPSHRLSSLGRYFASLLLATVSLAIL